MGMAKSRHQELLRVIDPDALITLGREVDHLVVHLTLRL
jgi:hypothetical protein